MLLASVSIVHTYFARPSHFVLKVGTQHSPHLTLTPNPEVSDCAHTGVSLRTEFGITLRLEGGVAYDGKVT